MSKGLGTLRDRPDVLGVAIRVHDPDRRTDLLLSTTGSGRLTRHVPVPRRTFDAHYGSITSYRTGGNNKIYLSAGPDRDGSSLGRTLDSVVVVGERHRGALVLYADRQAFGRVSFGSALAPEADSALAFDPVRNSSADLRPTGTLHGIRALAYRLSQRWRGVEPQAP